MVANDVKWAKPSLPISDQGQITTLPPVQREGVAIPPKTGFNKPVPGFAKYQGTGKVGGVYGPQAAPLVLTSNGVSADVKGHAARWGENGVDPVAVASQAFTEVIGLD
ncbi:MAG: hypothetical protein HYU97_05135 [Deltaproteobacteria bacterium]|nr:hypothetical protein [Deltaproteobacteria bacterium]